MLIKGMFASHIRASRNGAHDRVCEKAVHVAKEIKCALSGKTTFYDLVEAGQRALAETKPVRNKSVW